MVTNYFTFTLNFLDTPLLVTVMVAVPFFLPFTTPFAVTVATFLLLDVNLTFPVTSFFTTVMVVEVFPLV